MILEITLRFGVTFWFQSHSLRRLWCGGGASSLTSTAVVAIGKRTSRGGGDLCGGCRI